MIKEILLGNLEGIFMALLAYLIFVKYFPLKKIEDVEPYEKPLSLKRIRFSLVPIAYFGLMFYLRIVQAQRPNDSDPFSLTWKIYFGYSLFIIIVIIFIPNFILKNKSNK
jgi:hypothetical protein